jgi:F420-dependent oxidoreductase-like protein
MARTLPFRPVRFALMIEGQEDVTWPDWVALAEACERLGIEALFRSDHYLSVAGARDRGSLDAWGTVTALAATTTTLRLGTMVSPATFRHPSVIAKLATTADHVSGGRVELGLGTGWNEEEHRAYGFPFPSMGDRMAAFGEQLEVIHRSWEPGPFDLAGRFFTIEGLDALPKPVQDPHPTLIAGGSAGPKAAALAARWCDEYNLVFVTPEEAEEKVGAIRAACRAAGRDPSSIVLSMMTGCIVGADRDELARRAGAVAALQGQGDADPLEYARSVSGNWLVGTVDEVVQRLRVYEAAGIQRVFLQHLAHRDLEMVELVAREVMPAFA